MIAHWLEAFGRVRAPGRQSRVIRAREQLANHGPAADLAPAPGPRQLLVDVSVISGHDAGTGIQRIVRAIATQLLSSPPPGYLVRPVMATRKRAYRHVSWDTSELPVAGEDIRIHAGDVFLGLDLSAHIIPGHFRQLATWKRKGASLHFMVYDLLPLQYPHWFSGKLLSSFRRWIEAVATLADSAICISPSVEADLLQWLAENYHLASNAVPTLVIPMGWDITSTKPSVGLPEGFDTILARIKQHRTALIVGTLEPRKGHAQLLEAFEILWAADKACNLVIVGKPGWKTESLQKRLRQHPQLGTHLFWLDNASDEALLALYNACDGAVVASEAEGFGLPLVEALGHGKPVLARDLPVFRQLKAPGIHYFSAASSAALAPALAHWIDQLYETQASPPTLPTWQDSVSRLRAWLTANPPGWQKAPPSELAPPEPDPD